MADAGDVLNNNEIFGDVVETPKEDTEQHRKREELKTRISQGINGHMKWQTRASDEVINKTYSEYKQHKLNEKGKKTGKALGKHVSNLYSTGISRMVKIRDAHKLQQDIENDPIIKDQMASLGCLLLCTFGNLLAPALVAAHMVTTQSLAMKMRTIKVIKPLTLARVQGYKIK